MGRKVKEAEVKKLSPSQLSPRVQVSLSIHRSFFLSFFLFLPFSSFVSLSPSRNGISPEAHLKILLPLFHPHLHSFLQRRSLFERKTPLQGKEKKVTLCFSSSQNFLSSLSLLIHFFITISLRNTSFRKGKQGSKNNDKNGQLKRSGRLKEKCVFKWRNERVKEREDRKHSYENVSQHIQFLKHLEQEMRQKLSSQKLFSSLFPLSLLRKESMHAKN